MGPLTNYFTNTVKDFDQLFSSVFDGALSQEDVNNLEEYIVNRTSMRPKIIKEQ